MNTIKDRELAASVLNDVIEFYKKNPRKNEYESVHYMFSGLQVDFFYKYLLKIIVDEFIKDYPGFYITILPTNINTFFIGCIKVTTEYVMGKPHYHNFQNSWIDVEQKIKFNRQILLNNEFCK